MSGSFEAHLIGGAAAYKGKAVDLVVERHYIIVTLVRGR